MNRFLFLTTALILSTFLSFAQERTIFGTVTENSSGRPLENAKVKAKGTNIIALTNADGEYTIVLPEGVRTLTFSHDQMIVVEVEIKNQNTIDVSMVIRDINIFSLSLEELLNVKVVSASNKKERLTDAPATVIVITQEEIKKRGYTDLTEIFNDLPGMDISRSYGATPYKVYWRGYRNTIGSPYLLMVDGVIENHLWFNETYTMVIVPISNVEKVEIVYGPASSVYGANAFMGVVNVITKKDIRKNGTKVWAKTEISQHGGYRGDYNMIYKKDDFRVSLSVKADDYDMFDFLNLESYEFTKTKYLTDTLLWGKGLVNSNLGSVSSPVKNRSVDIRTYFGGIEFGIKYYKLNQGNGVEYPFDAVQPSVLWPYDDFGIHLRYVKDFTDNFQSRTLVRYRETNVPGDGGWIEGYNSASWDNANPVDIGGVMVNPGESARVVDFSYWGSYNSSWSFFQDLDYDITKKFSITFGYKFESKDLQKAYDEKYGVSLHPSIANDVNSLFLDANGAPVTPFTPGYQYNNRENWMDHGGYTQLKFKFTEDHLLNGGMRIDNNSIYGTAYTFRAGYVGHFDELTTKILFGQAYMEPNPRNLYGGWSGIGSAPDLEPEKSYTIETSLGYTKSNFSSLVSAYLVNNSNTIFNVTGGAENLGDRHVLGVDYHLSLLLEIPSIDYLKFWHYGSFILQEEEAEFNSDGVKMGEGIIGDLAHAKFYMGATANINKHFSATLLGRYIGERKPYAAKFDNTASNIDGYFTLDANLMLDNIIHDGISLGLKINNVLGTTYFHPGLIDQSAGYTPGKWDANGLSYSGSNGWNNSILPQSKRLITFSFYIDL